MISDLLSDTQALRQDLSRLFSFSCAVFHLGKVRQCPCMAFLAALRGTYRVGSGIYAGNDYTGAQICVMTHWRSARMECSWSNRADNEISRMAQAG